MPKVNFLVCFGKNIVYTVKPIILAVILLLRSCGVLLNV